jgi:hypothetical protein
MKLDYFVGVLGQQVLLSQVRMVLVLRQRVQLLLVLHRQ